MFWKFMSGALFGAVLLVTIAGVVALEAYAYSGNAAYVHVASRVCCLYLVFLPACVASTFAFKRVEKGRAHKEYLQRQVDEIQKEAQRHVDVKA
jgi:hypothetical protein